MSNVDRIEEVEISEIELSHNLNDVFNSGLFDFDYYHLLNPDVARENAIVHYYFNGYAEGRKPSFLFDPKWYIEQNPDVQMSGMKPLTHYIFHGDSEGRRPSIYFDKLNFLDKIPLNYNKTSLCFFYENELAYKLSAHEYFDINYYLDSYPDVRDANVSPYYHFIMTGVYEGRSPRSDIDIVEYCKLYEVNCADINPFEHFICIGGYEYLQNKSVITSLSLPCNLMASELSKYRQAGESYEEPKYLDSEQFQPNVKALAYYLPQYHPFKENDEWWGQGFTEWTNVTRGISRFNGHYQPHLPKHLGYYDLRVKEAMLEQVRYAKAGGLYGFCFYHYWFNGKRIMDKPVNMLLENKDIDFPFCIMWANENWTRTWDGFENDVLIAQDYLEEDDVPFINDLGRHFKDERYIRIDGRPLFFIYRPGIIPNAKATIFKWRRLCKELLNEDPLFYMAQAFGDLDPREFAMDGAIEFPPHKIAAGLGDSSRQYGGFESDFTGHYPSYDELIESSLRESTQDYPLIRGVTPTWDNEARKPGRGMGFVGSTPEKYENWLRNIVKYAQQNPITESNSFVVVNAWNEWAEGAHLEPDVYNGAAYLNSTYRALHDIYMPKEKLKLILVGHDAYKHGAQLLTLNIFKTLRNRFGIDAHCILLDGGPLVEEYQNVGPTYVVHGSLEEFNRIVGEINQDFSFAHAICNTTVSGLCTEKLSQHGIKVISLIHELSTLIKEYSLEGHVETIFKHAERVVFAADFVKESFESFTGSLNDQAIVKPQGIYQNLVSDQNAYHDLRRKLSLPKDAKIVVNSGYADLRKGFDLFVQIAKQSVAIDAKYHFVWLGNVEPSLKNWILKDIVGSKLEKHIHIVPFTNKISLYLEGADVFAMTSREDPFPSVVLEALALGTPVVGFLGGGGFTDALEEDYFGELVPMSDCAAFTAAIENQIKLDNKESQAKRAAFASEKYDWGDYVFSLVELLIPTLKRVSVAVPNYNYEQHIGDRLKSIFHQHYPIYELIVLDDKSPDSSVDIITSTAKQFNRETKLIVNESNSGSVFKQWAKAAKLAKGDYLWIAEADDLAEPEFISTIMAGDTDFSLAYTDSKQIDENDTDLADNYRYYYDQGMVKLLDKSGIFDGNTVIEEALAIKNQFMNVSSVMFKTQSLVDCFDQYMQDVLKFKVAGDWFVYVQLLSVKDARCKLVSDALNVHRRHSGSVTMQNYDVQLEEIAEIQKLSAEFADVDVLLQADYLKEVETLLRG